MSALRSDTCSIGRAAVFRNRFNPTFARHFMQLRAVRGDPPTRLLPARATVPKSRVSERFLPPNRVELPVGHTPAPNDEVATLCDGKEVRRVDELGARRREQDLSTSPPKGSKQGTRSMPIELARYVVQEQDRLHPA